MRIYNKWYKELWFWIQENKEETIMIILGFLIGLLFVWSYATFNKTV